MKLPLANLGAVVAKWMDEELVPKATGLQKVVTVMAGIGLAKTAADTVKQYIPAMVLLGFADNDGNMDIDALHEAAKAAFEKTGKVMLPGGIIFGEADVESIVAIARKFASDNTPKE